jgi:hypothetical protein
MDIYHIWCDLGEGVSDLSFSRSVHAYLEHLRENGGLSAYRVTRRKLGLGPRSLGEFHIMLEFESLAELDTVFGVVAQRVDPVEALHRAVYSKVKDLRFALYRDFPDRVRRHSG